MKFCRSSSFYGLPRPSAARPRASSSHSNSLLLVPPEIEVTGSGFGLGRSMSGLMGGWSRQFRSTATKSLLPGADSPTTLQRTIATLQQPSVAVRNFLPAAAAASRFFSGNTLTFDILRGIIDSEPPVVFGIPVGSPWEIFDPSLRSDEGVTYHYKYNGEIVYVQVVNDDENSGNSKSSAIDFGVLILKQQARTVLVFYISALDGEMRIHSLAFGDYSCYDHPLDCDPLPYDFSRLDEDLQAACYKYLAVRGITADWYIENKVLYFR